MDAPTDMGPVAPLADEINRLWQHGLHEERLFHDRLNYFSAIQVGLLGVFSVLYHKEPSPGVFMPLTATALILALLWLRIQVRHWRYCVHVNQRIEQSVPDYARTVAGYGARAGRNGLSISQPLAWAVPVLFAGTWVALFAWVMARAGW